MVAEEIMTAEKEATIADQRIEVQDQITVAQGQKDRIAVRVRKDKSVAHVQKALDQKTVVQDQITVAQGQKDRIVVHVQKDKNAATEINLVHHALKIRHRRETRMMEHPSLNN
jgi:4-diphosphocytidyl-2C-methyl-D-erythritol kinase